MEVDIKKLYDGSKVPVKGDEHAAAWDLYAHTVDQRGSLVEVGTGVAIAIPKGYMGVIAPRSNISKHGWMLANSIGIIDPTYSNEWLCMFRPVGLNSKPFPYKSGERVAQMFLLPVVGFDFNEVDELIDHGRGEGFGSTGLG